MKKLHIIYCFEIPAVALENGRLKALYIIYLLFKHIKIRKLPIAFTDGSFLIFYKK